MPDMGKLAPKDKANGKFRALKAKHFTDANRDQRIAKALAILDLPVAHFSLDKETWKWAAENAEIEDV